MKLSKAEQLKLEKQNNFNESDSEPSCDNFDEKDLVERFEAAISDDEDEQEKEKELEEPKKEEKDEEPDESKPDLQQQMQQQSQMSAITRKEQQIQKMSDDLDDMKKKTKKLYQRFDFLKEQINAKILQDQ